MFSRPFSHRRLTVASPLLALLLLMTVQVMAETNPYRWYYHNTTKNETSAALTAAIQNKCGLLVFVGKPGCHICEVVWSSSYDGTAMMDGAGKMAAYLKSHSLVGLKIEDSQSHFSDLASGAMGYRNSDGSATNTNAPFLVLVQVKEGKENDENFDLTSRNSDIEYFFGGYGSLVMYDKTYAKITAWLNGLLATDEYKTRCPGDLSPALESPNPLEFFEADPAYLGTDDAGQLITANAVGKAPTSLSSSKKELYYKFHAETGRRYLFTVTAASSTGAPTLAELVAKKLQLTCAVLSIGTSGAPSATAVAEKSNATYGFRVLDEGFFFVPVVHSMICSRSLYFPVSSLYFHTFTT